MKAKRPDELEEKKEPIDSTSTKSPFDKSKGGS